MNNTQVAKVAHEATRALAETTGESAEPKWEELSDQQRTDKVHNIGSHVDRAGKGIDTDTVAKPLSETERLKFYIHSAISEAFSRHEKSVTGGNSLEHNRGETGQPSIDEINRQNALKREAAANERDAGPQTVEEAQAKAEQDIAASNEENKPEENAGSDSIH